ncbi:hypothetical protein EV189_0146 [Motilibacter rhizosphaerae]|uniref:Amine oxidase domain-containing protein n=1 Tax=Motilibacter rhizosphaerae TaxID=598652 RepID=A0A4Q7NUL9_9ACTN|nr:FAD-dependent oxidoreductase [Motilibacter rhizosphaerae]RZS90916.1 hypothetical protein EV189_0146 [Motilibacter rhizosphaerae]
MSVVVVGGGISGSACAAALQAAGARVQLLDRAHRPGGRMAGYDRGGRIVDLGASYLTVSGDALVAQVERWESAGLARRWTDTFAVSDGETLTGTRSGPLRWAATGGLHTLVADLQRGVAVRQECEVEAVGPGPLVQARDGREELADAVVLAMPDPQAADLLADSLDAELEQVAEREWAPALSVALRFPERSWDADLHGVFVNGSAELAWIADDGDRRGDGAPVLVLHSTAELAEEHLDDVSAALPQLVGAVRRILQLPDDPVEVHTKRWSLARPVEPREEPFFLGDAMVGLCGDGWHAPARVESAYASGRALADELLRRLG